MDETPSPEILEWLLSGDVSLQYQVRRDLLGEYGPNLEILRNRIAEEGWGKAILERRKSDGHWGRGYYLPKWTSTHYTLLELMHLGIPPDTPGPSLTVEKVIRRYLGDDGGLYSFSGGTRTDDCVVAMFLQTAVYFNAGKGAQCRMADFILRRLMNDGGWNCRSDRGRAVLSSVHTTISCLEPLRMFQRSNPEYRNRNISAGIGSGENFLLEHQLCRSHRTGEIMDSRMLMFSWPVRWYFDILRGLSYFAESGRIRDSRLSWPVSVLLDKRRRNGRWPVQNRHPGESHILMEKTGGDSRWNTLRALRVLRAYYD